MRTIIWDETWNPDAPTLISLDHKIVCRLWCHPWVNPVSPISLIFHYYFFKKKNCSRVHLKHKVDGTFAAASPAHAHSHLSSLY